MFDKLKQFNEMRKQAEVLKKALAEEEIIGSSANSLVKIIMDGNQEIKSVFVDESILGNKFLLEKSIKEAVDDSNKKLRQTMLSKMGGFGGLGNLLG